ncbi:MAG: thioesterase family protein [Saprospiraceae bacterium]|nr:thioesterase family protein [Saprospiraceae bacterium]
MYSHEVTIRVRYGETDQMGYLYYGNYAEYFEVGRVELIRSLGLSYKELEEVHGIWLPVVSLEMRFVRPAYYDDLLTVRSTLKEMPDEHITFHVEILNEKRKLVNSGRVRLCFFDAKSKKVVMAPEFLLERLRPAFENITNTE